MRAALGATLLMGALVGSAAYTELQPAHVVAGTLGEDEYSCYSFNVPDRGSGSHLGDIMHIYLRMVNTGSATTSDPDLYVSKGEVQPTTTDYDFEDYSMDDIVVLHISDDDQRLPGPWTACVHGYGGDTAFTLELLLAECPATVDKKSATARDPMQLCDGHGTCRSNYCRCDEGYNVAGVDDCSATVIEIDRAATSPMVKAVEQDGWVYFHMNVQSTDKEVHADMFRIGEAGDPDIYMRFGEPPTLEDFDVADLTAEAMHTVISKRGDDSFPAYGPVDLWIGVYGFTESRFSLSLSVFQCDNGCGGHGTCHNGECMCEDEWNLFANCSALTVRLEHDADSERFTMAKEEMLAYEIHVDDVTAKNHVEMEIITDWTSEEGLEMLSPFRPVMYMGEHTVPTDQEHLYKMELEPGQNTLLVPASHVRRGNYYVTIANPFRNNIYLHVVLAFHSFCPNDCNDNGKCGIDGECACEEGFVGADCVELPKSKKAGMGSGGATFLAFSMLFIGSLIGAAGLAFYVRKYNPDLLSTTGRLDQMLGGSGYYEPPGDSM